MFTYTSSYFVFICINIECINIECINNVRSPQVKEKEKTAHRGFFLHFNAKDPYLEMFIQERKLILWSYLDLFDIYTSGKKISVLLSW